MGNELDVRLYARLTTLGAAACVALTACAGGLALSPSTAMQPAQRDRRIVVSPGQSIQAAVDRAIPGDTVVVEPGTYREPGRPCPFDARQTCAVSITTPAISLEALGGKKPVVLEGSDGIGNGIAVGRSYACSRHILRRSRIVGFVVRGFSETGISLRCVGDWELAYDVALHDGLYGFESDFSNNGRIHDNVAAGAAHAGFHVGLSQSVRIDHNVARDNVMGFEVREMIRATVDHDTAFSNTAGIFELIMPGDRLERSIDNVLRDNLVTLNDRPNTCADPGDPVCLIPPGVGIAIAGGERNLNLRNRVVGNKTFGIAVTDVCSAFEIPKDKCGRLPFDPLPRDTRTLRNIALENGVDLLWTANGSGNCWSGNRSRVRVPDRLPQCSGVRPF